MRRALLILSVLSLFTAFGQAADAPYKLATLARLDLQADAAVAELQQGEALRGSAKVERMNWLAAAEQPRGYVISAPISSRAWRDIEVRFIPLKSGSVVLALKGMWEETAPKSGVIFRTEVLWDALQVSGAKLDNGSFEMLTNGKPAGWTAAGGAVIESTPDLPARDGRRMGRTWHNGTLQVQLQVAAGQEVRLKAAVRAALPPDFREMKRLANRDTPAHRAAKQFRHGVNFGNYLEVPPSQNWAVPHSIQDVQQAAKEGFDHIRIPIGWQHYAAGPDFRISPSIYAKVDPLVAEAVRHKLGVMINIHHYDDFTTAPDKHRENFLKLWRQIAEHYATQPDGVSFELLNEPKDAATTDVLNPIIAEAIAIIRQSNPRRPIFVPTGRWNSAFELSNLRLPDDDNLIVTLHCYDPFYFTHQGASWAGPDVSVKGIRFPGPPTSPLMLDPQAKLNSWVVDWVRRYNSQPLATNPSSPAAFEAHISEAREWSDYFGRPVHFGEFGCFTTADAESRAAYYRLFRESLNQA